MNDKSSHCKNVPYRYHFKGNSYNIGFAETQISIEGNGYDRSPRERDPYEHKAEPINPWMKT
jgi:hypothetical protein